jgi:ABC-type transport system involved in multi-copper enzyme maturation permease subunit
MNWVLWRQYRTTALIAGVLLILTIAFLLISGFHILTVVQQLRLTTSCIHNQQNSFCIIAYDKYYQQTAIEQIIGVLWLYLFPLLIGLFVGAPLIAREWEQGTYRLAWTQSVSRSRWLTHRLCILAIVTLLASIIPALLASWWAGPQISITSTWSFYDIRGLMPIAYALFAFALGTACGTLLRKTLPAMALTLLFFLVVHIAIAIWLRPHFLPPLMSPLLDPAAQSEPAQLQNGLTVQTQYTDSQGHAISFDQAFSVCSSSPENTDLCMHDHGIRYYSLYQPADRFWLFQSIESTLYIVLMLALLGLTAWLVRKRLS